MAYRLVEAIIPKNREEEVSKTLEENELVIDFWIDIIEKEKISAKMIVTAEKSQNVIDSMTEKFSTFEKFRLIVHPLAAISPQPEEKEKEEETEEEKTETASISREELYSVLKDRSKLSVDYIVLISLAAIVAAIGVLGNTMADMAVIIGAMVIAPMVGPNMGLSLATTLADPVLGKESLRTIFLGILAVFLISAVVGFFLLVDPGGNSFILTRLEPEIADVALALSAGMAGAIAFTRDVATALIGVMVSISLLPTLVSSGLLFGGGFWMMAGGAMVLFLINLTCINLAGVLTFLVEGIQPRSWYEADKAKRMSRWATLIWVLLLAALIVIIIYSQWV